MWLPILELQFMLVIYSRSSMLVIRQRVCSLGENLPESLQKTFQIVLRA